MRQISQFLALGLLAGSTLMLVVPLPALSSWPLLQPVGPRMWIGLGGAACLLLVVAACSPGAVLPGVISAVSGALLTTAVLGQYTARTWPASLADTEWIVEGQVIGVPRRGEGYQTLDFRPEQLTSPGGLDAPGHLPLRIRISGRASSPMRSGERWRLHLRLRPPDGRMNGAGFDKRRWLVGERVEALGTLKTRMQAERLEKASSLALAVRVDRWRADSRDSVESLSSLDREQAALIAALSVGLDDTVPDEVMKRLQATGTAHLLAISGLHVSFLFAGALWLFRSVVLARTCASPVDEAFRLPNAGAVPHSLWLPLDADQLCVLLALAVSAIYAVCAGFDLPVRRALLMLIVATTVLLRRRSTASATALAVAVIGVLLLDPLAPLNAGFWLSAGTVALILWLQIGRKAQSGLVQALGIQWMIGLALLVPGAWWFGEVSLVAPLANLIAIPWTTMLIVPGALLTAVLAPLFPLFAELLAMGVALSISALLEFLQALEGIPGAHQPMSLPGSFGLIVAMVAVLLVSFPGTLLWIGFVPFLVLPLVLHAARGTPVSGVELHVLDVGHGLAALVLTESSTVLIDTGGGHGPATRLETDVLPYLLGLGRRRVDHLILSHADHDHAAGLVPLLARQPELPVYTSDIGSAVSTIAASGLQLDDAQLRQCQAGRGFEIEGLSFDFLHPAEHDRGDDNNRSCVLLVHGAGVRLLLPGDIEAESESMLIARSGQLPLDVLVAPHHGSRTSSTSGFVKAFPTDHVVFPAARYSQWGFPHTIVQMRYKLSGARLHHTGSAGALVFRFPDALHDSKRVSFARGNQRLWRAPLVDVESLQPPVATVTGIDH